MENWFGWKMFGRQLLWKCFGGKFWWKIFGGNAIFNIIEPLDFQKYIIHLGLGSTWYLSLSVSVCFCIFVSLCLGHCHHQMIGFQKIYDLYGPEHHTVEINGDVTTRYEQLNKDRATQVMDTECRLRI